MYSDSVRRSRRLSRDEYKSREYRCPVCEQLGYSGKCSGGSSYEEKFESKLLSKSKFVVDVQHYDGASVDGPAIFFESEKKLKED